VKRWGKSPPRRWQQRWHGNPQSEQGQISGEVRPAPIMDEAGACVVRIQAAGRLLEAAGDGRPRQMTIWRKFRAVPASLQTELGLRSDLCRGSRGRRDTSRRPRVTPDLPQRRAGE
jgi:hypothetical protein